MGDMGDLMNNPMVKNMMNNPEMMKMAAEMMGGGGPAGGMPDPSKMQEMMKDPSMAKMLDNPDFLAQTVGMLKNPMAKSQLEGLTKQSGLAPDTIIKMLEYCVSMAYGYKKIKPAMPFIKYSMLILVVSYLLKWTGFTTGLIFMMPFQ